MTISPVRVALVDDDEAVLDSLRLYFTRKGLDVACFPDAASFLEALDRAGRFDCIVADVRMPEISGLELVSRVIGRGSLLPTILITGHGDVDMAVSAIKMGAFDFIEKPFDEDRLLASIRAAVDASRLRHGEAVELEDLRQRFATLSARQREVMQLAAAGLSNKEIGNRLNISSKTVENHRAWVMERMGARNLADLVRMAMRLEQGTRHAPG